MNANLLGLRGPSMAATPLSERARSYRNSPAASLLESDVASDLPAHSKTQRTTPPPRSSRSALNCGSPLPLFPMRDESEPVDVCGNTFTKYRQERAHLFQPFPHPVPLV